MKIKATQKAWFRNSLIQEGDILNFKGDVLPCWATLASGEESAPKNENVPQEPIINENEGNENNNPENDNPEDDTDNANQEETDEVTEETSELTEEQLQAELDRIIDIAVANEVWVDVPTDTPIAEQINLFKEALTNKGIELH